ncbi:MAG: ribosomal protein S18-alanine N-acetyltransferase [Actinomycetes bacterium]
MTSDTLVVRPMRWWDIAAVHTIEQQAFPDTAWSQETFWSELAGVPDTRHYLVATSDETLVAYAGLMAVGREADVQTLAVSRSVRRTGLGRRLLDALIDEAARRHCSRLSLEVASHAEGARKLYLARGFEVSGRRSGYYGSGHDALVMQLPLTSGDVNVPDESSS